MARAWDGDDGPYLARRPAVREDGALGTQARPGNLSGRARARCGCVLARGGARRGKHCWLTVKVCTGRQIRADQTVGSSPGRPGWLLLAVAVPLPLRVCGRRGGEARGIAIDWVTGRSGPLTRWEERAQCTIRPPLAPRVSRRERCSGWDGTPEKGEPGRLGLAGTLGGPCLWGCLSGSRVVWSSSSGASWRVGRGRFAGREASAVGGLLPARRRGLGACSSLPSGVAGAVCSVRLGLVRGASRRPWRRSFGWGGAGKGTSPGCAVGSCGGRTRPLVARVTRSVAIGAQKSQAMQARPSRHPQRVLLPLVLPSIDTC